MIEIEMTRIDKDLISFVEISLNDISSLNDEYEEYLREYKYSYRYRRIYNNINNFCNNYYVSYILSYISISK